LFFFFFVACDFLSFASHAFIMPTFSMLISLFLPTYKDSCFVLSPPFSISHCRCFVLVFKNNICIFAANQEKGRLGREPSRQRQRQQAVSVLFCLFLEIVYVLCVLFCCDGLVKWAVSSFLKRTMFSRVLLLDWRGEQKEKLVINACLQFVPSTFFLFGIFPSPFFLSLVWVKIQQEQVSMMPGLSPKRANMPNNWRWERNGGGWCS
jgi:hypothetical protein